MSAAADATQNQSGKLEKDEARDFCSAYIHSKVKVDQAEHERLVSSLVEEMGADGDGVISWENFLLYGTRSSSKEIQAAVTPSGHLVS